MFTFLRRLLFRFRKTVDKHIDCRVLEDEKPVIRRFLITGFKGPYLVAQQTEGIGIQLLREYQAIDRGHFDRIYAELTRGVDIRWEP